MSELNVGIVGLGAVAGAHIETFKNVTGGTVTGVSSRRPQEPAALEEEYGLPLRPYATYEEMLGDPDLHVVDICTPHSLHAEQAVQAAEAGKHLIVEKPVATNFADCERVAAAIRANGVQAMVCFECRFSAHFRMIRSMLDQGLIGDVHYAEVDYYHGIGPWYGQFPWNVKKDVGTSSLATAGCHALDGLLFFLGGPDGKAPAVAEVSSFATRSKSEIFAPYEYDTSHVSILRLADGRTAKCASIIDCLQPYYFHVHLVGSHGSILDDRFYSSKLDGMDKNRWSKLETFTIDSGAVEDHPYQPQFQAFVDATKRGEPMPWTDFDTALDTHRVMFAADESAAEGRPVTLG
ncbi:MAG: Gfo/Idh/MocA family oxidoreductase [Planctomycetota bacterium]